jgi:hypothetical protein
MPLPFAQNGKRNLSRDGGMKTIPTIVGKEKEYIAYAGTLDRNRFALLSNGGTLLLSF